MKKKIILAIFSLIIVFFILNYKIFLGSYYFLKGNQNYEINDFSGALNLYTKSQKFLSGTILSYNIGNTYYKLGEKLKNIDEKIDFNKKSLNIFDELLKDIKDKEKHKNDDVVYNYEFIKKKLEELEKQKQKNIDEKEKNNLDENEDNKDKQDEIDNKDIKDVNQDKIDKNIIDDQKTEEDIKQLKMDENSAIGPDLSLQDLLEIDNYVIKLKDEEKYNRQFYNNFSNLQNTPVFEEIDTTEKDW